MPFSFKAANFSNSSRLDVLTLKPQIKNGKRPGKCKGGKQIDLQNARILTDFLCGGVSELADEHDLGSCAARRRGSSPLFPTISHTRQ